MNGKCAQMLAMIATAQDGRRKYIDRSDNT